MQAFGMRANPILFPIDIVIYFLLAIMTDGRKYVNKCRTIPAVKARLATMKNSEIGLFAVFNTLSTFRTLIESLHSYVTLKECTYGW